MRPQHPGPGVVGVVRLLVDGNANRVALALEERASLHQVVPGVDGRQTVGVEDVLAIQRRKIDEVLGYRVPDAFIQTQRLTERDPSAVRLADLLGDVAHVSHLVVVERGLTVAAELVNVVAGASRHLGGVLGRQVVRNNVIRLDFDLVLGAPILGPLVEPRVVRRHEVR